MCFLRTFLYISESLNLLLCACVGMYVFLRVRLYVSVRTRVSYSAASPNQHIHTDAHYKQHTQPAPGKG